MSDSEETEKNYSPWWASLDLPERVQASQSTSQSVTSSSTVSGDVHQRQEQVEKWCNNSVFNGDKEQFRKRLAAEGLDEESVVRVAGRDAVTIPREKFEDSWQARLTRIFSTDSANDATYEESATEKLGLTGFQWAVLPLVMDGWSRLRAEVTRLGESDSQLRLNRDRIEHSLCADLAAQLVDQADRVLVLDLNVASIQGDLSGDTPGERFHSYLQRLRDPQYVLSLLLTYPVLGRQLLVTTDKWVTNSSAILWRLSRDRELVTERIFRGADPGTLVNITPRAGDQHGGRQSVHILHFDSGRSLVYKPRALAIELTFQSLLQWLNERGLKPELRPISVLDRGKYGWVEYVAQESCGSQHEVERFYERLGANLAIVYALHGRDFHHENIIAVGEQPVLVDMEGLLHAKSSENKEFSDPVTFVVSTFYDSIVRTGFVPSRSFDYRDDGIDISGIGGGKEGERTPFKVGQWVDSSTDQMHLVQSYSTLPRKLNRPLLNGEVVEPTEYREQVVDGFERTYRLLARHSDDLTRPGGVLDWFEHAEVRYIPRSSAVYGSILQQSFHPDYLADALDRDQFFDKLWSAGPQVHHVWLKGQDEFATLYRHEVNSLRAGEIPLFLCTPESRDVWTTSGETIDKYFEQNALKASKEHILSFDEDKLKYQRWILEASLLTANEGTGRERAARRSFDSCGSGYAKKDELIAAALSIGDTLKERCLRSSRENYVGWLGVSPGSDKAGSVAAAGVDLYSGLSGIALFLAYLGEISGTESYRQLAEDTADSIVRHWDFRINDSSIPHADYGPMDANWQISGSILALTRLGTLWKKPELLEHTDALVDLLPERVAKDEDYTFVGGAAGCGAVLSELLRARFTDRAFSLVEQCGELLVSRAVPMERGAGWTNALATTPLTGFAHGASGVAHSLLAMAETTGKSHFRETAAEALEYERSLFDPARGNWPDLRELQPREEAAGREFLMAWCHGAPGVGLARLTALHHLSDDRLREEAQTAVRTTTQRGMLDNESLCHGSLGNLELLSAAGNLFSDDALIDRVYRSAGTILARQRERGWRCGVSDGVETPGLLEGLSGIGYGLLRLADRQRVPSVLAPGPSLAAV